MSTHPVLDSITKLDDAPKASAQPPELTRQSVFIEAEEAPLSMHDIAEALASKRAENKVKVKRLATLCQEMADLLNSFDA